MECIACNSKSIVKNGYYKDYQKYKCRNCNKQFSERSFSFFYRHRFPDEVIKNTILYGMFVSIRNTVYLIKETLQFSFSHVTSFNWIKKFANTFITRSFTHEVSSVWHVDEKFIKVKGSTDKFAYLWVVMDDNNTILAVHVSDKRDKDGAITVFRKASKKAGRPEILVSDGWHSYKKACKRVFGRKTKHVIAHFKPVRFMHKGSYYILSNNRIESLNSKINLWYKKFRGFKKLSMANLWCGMWMYFYNLIRPRAIPHKIISIHQIIH